MRTTFIGGFWGQTTSSAIWLVSAALVGSGVLIALYFSGSFGIGGWVGGALLLAFAWIGRATVRAEALASRPRG